MKASNSASRLWLAGPAAAALFALSLVGFAAMRSDGYSHATKAVSELGAIGAPFALAFNIVGFILPGVLIVVFASRLIQQDESNRSGPILLAMSGTCLALAGLAPADMFDDEAFTTILHATGAIGSGVFWVCALFWVGPLLRERFGLKTWGRVTPWFSLFLLANVGWQVSFRMTGLVMPGWGQRIAFFGFFLWFAVTGVLLWRYASHERRKAGMGV
ncbi:MAG: hypothetical protein CMN69_01565 [Sphingomonadaceae bacterium]|nr:hypothetical protein [Sphingomonadaceae bacterium]|tara:strand:- start:61 stop:708 length:648 start_codon:yes stop_codon:yes gene_type:complete